LPPSDLRRISNLFTVFDLDLNGWIQSTEMLVLVKMAVGGTASFVEEDFKKMVIEMGGEPESGVSLDIVHKAFQRKHGALYNLMSALPTKEQEDMAHEMGTIKQSKAAEILATQRRLSDDAFAVVDTNEDGVADLLEILPVLKFWRPLASDEELRGWFSSSLDRYRGMDEEGFFKLFYLEGTDDDLRVVLGKVQRDRGGVPAARSTKQSVEWQGIRRAASASGRPQVMQPYIILFSLLTVLALFYLLVRSSFLKSRIRSKRFHRFVRWLEKCFWITSAASARDSERSHQFAILDPVV